jgi:translation elongation factor EF-Tu-like GTPase
MAGFAEVEVEFLSTENGGRQSPVWLGEDTEPRYRPHLVVKGGDGEYLGVEFVDGPDEPISPGRRCFATVRFVYEPRVNCSALKVGAEFEVREGPKVIGVGRVTRSD